MSDKLCRTCCWFSTGFGDEIRGSGWFYSDEAYRDVMETCSFWQATLRHEPLIAPDLKLVDAVAKLDTDVED